MVMFKECSRGAYEMRRASVVAMVTVTLVMCTTCRAAFMVASPQLSNNLAQHVTVTCSGANGCASSMDEATCNSSKVCELKCPSTSRTDFPDIQFPLISWTQDAGCNVSTNTPSNPPATANSSNGLLALNGTAAQCTVSNPNVATTSGRMALSFWISSACNDNCTLARIGQGSKEISVFLSNNKLCINTFCDTTLTDWKHVILQVFESKVDMMVDGVFKQSPTVPGLSASVGIILGAPTSLGAGNSYQMYDVRYYNDILTFREIQSIFSNTTVNSAIPMSDCRCPYTHTTLKQGDAYTCTDGNGAETKRLSAEFYTPQTLVDGNTSNFWAGPGNGDFILTVDLQQEYQLEKVEVTFQSAVPAGTIMVELPNQTDQLNCSSTSTSCSLSKVLPQNLSPETFAGYVVQVFNLTFVQPGSNIVLSSVVVTGRCNCNGNAQTCNTSASPYVCECESDTYTTGDRCESCLSNRYRDTSQFDCQNTCNCDEAGAHVGAVCNKSDGQCTCKSNVKGRTCSECKDGFYKLDKTQSDGCLTCQCSPIGSISNTCDKISGQCPCADGLDTSQNCTPRVRSVSPLFGPFGGGTVVTIKGQLLGNGSQEPSVFLDNLPQQILSHDMSTIIFNVSKPSVNPRPVPLIINWTQEEASIRAANFTFKADPVLDTSQLPTVVAMYTSGGCGVLFKGRNFGSVAFPKMEVKDGSAGNTTYGNCIHQNQGLRCIGPDLTSMPSPRDNFSFGLHLDGVKYLDLGPVQVTKDPQVNVLGSYDLQYPFEQNVIISGSRLASGGCQQAEISILINGVLNCDIVKLTDTEIECKPPRNLQGTKGSVIQVTIGSRFSREVGELNYLEFWETSYFIGIMCGIGALVLLVIVIIIFCRCRRRRSMNTSTRQSQMGLTEKSLNGSPAPQNQYSELPVAGTAVVNNGFQDPIQAETVIREPKEILPPTAKEFDLMTEFLNRVEPSLWESIKIAVVSANDLTLGRLCTNKGNVARIIDGQFATERAGQRTEKKVTIKTLKDPLPAEGMLPKWTTAALRECLRLHRLSDDNVLSITGLALDKERFHIIYPYMQNRTLKDHIVDANKDFSVRQLVEFGLQVSEGLAYLHSKDLIHKDLAARNCMVDAADVVKISDAAFSWDFYGDEYVYDSARERYMPVRWMAPESLTDGYYDKRTDVWSLGVLLWELLTRGCLPFHEVEDTQVKDYIIEGYMLGKPENCSDQLYEVMQGCWGAENEHRPGVSIIVSKLGEELTDEGVEQYDIYVNLGTVEGHYENQDALGKPRRKAPMPPRV